MPNQRAIAKAAGVSQATVSKALRGMTSIPLVTRQRIEALAQQLDYHPNAYVTTLMTHIRSGRPPSEKGCIAILADGSLAGGRYWGKGGYTTRLRFDGIRRRAQALGFAAEFFYIQPSAREMDRLARTLEARGITALILTSLRSLDPSQLPLPWEKFAVAALDYTWPFPHVDRITAHRHHNTELALAMLKSRGYRRVGMCLPTPLSSTHDTPWKENYLLWQARLSARDRIPLFAGTPETTTLAKFQSWLRRHKPEAILGLVGHEKEWLDALDLRQPDDIGLLCLNRPPESDLSGVEEKHEVTGEAVVDMVVAQIQRNEFGLPAHPKLILIEGKWVEGKTIRPAA